ncbi:hypothetical protein FRB99_005894 [Tulasnella sp. 403]|nr:hypothetical protein FRB99_005894 [Tulasnella sp. 403]
MLAALLLAAAGSIPSLVAATDSQFTTVGTGPGTFEIVGESGVSAQQLFLGNDQKVYILDKTQNNAAQVAGHPAWATEYDLTTNQYRTMDVLTNTFCAGGNSLGDGRWLVVGGNQPVTYGGNATVPGGPDPYKDQDGGLSIRWITPCTDGACNYELGTMSTRRWYATVEPLPDGSAIIIGGNLYGGYVNNQGNNNPTYEFFPSRGPVQNLTLLMTTLPANLYSLTWLTPGGKLFIQTNWAAELFDYNTGVEDPLPNVPHAVRTYPASAATAMLPLTPANNYTATVLFCGGSDLQPDQWTAGLDMTQVPASASCVTISPDTDRTWHDDDDLPDGRTMGNFIMLPDKTLFLCNGANMGTAGYGTEPWTKGDSYADQPIFQPLIYDPSKPAGSRFSQNSLHPSTVARMYHSTATLLPDGSVFVAGSSPHPDVVVDNTQYPTEYRVERFYPWYFQKPRPQPVGVPTNLTYGGKPFDIKLSAADLNKDGAGALEQTEVVVIRTGFATHAINFGQRIVQLDNTYTLNADGSAVLHVAQLPPNPNILAPGPAWMYVTVNGVPSIGVQIMVGSGKIENQPILAASVLPAKSVPQGTTVPTNTTSQASSNNGGSGNGENAGVRSVVGGSVFMTAATAVLAFGLASL